MKKIKNRVRELLKIHNIKLPKDPILADIALLDYTIIYLSAQRDELKERLK